MLVLAFKSLAQRKVGFVRLIIHKNLYEKRMKNKQKFGWDYFVMCNEK